MAKVNIFSIGKTKEPWLKLAIEEYSRRLKPILSIQWHLARKDDELVQLCARTPRLIALDPKAEPLTSEAFSTTITQLLEEGGSTLNFVIGGAEGLSPSILKKSLTIISLSSLTFTHQLTRLILLEQLYRAFEIQKGSNYHK